MSAAPLWQGGGGEVTQCSNATKTQSISGTFFGNHLQGQFTHHPEPSDSIPHNYTFGEPEIPYWLTLLFVTLASKLPWTVS